MQPTLSDGTEQRWTLFVGGTEVNDFLMDFEQATGLAKRYIEDEYDDLVIMQYDTGEEIRIV